MKKSTSLVAALILFVAGEHVAISGSSGSRSSSSGTSGRSGSGSAYRAVSPSKSGSGSISGFRYRSAAGASRGSATRQSLLADAPGASPKLAHIIEQKERSSGPGWLGTAFLIALLSHHDLSSSDRSWIQSRIDAIGAGDEQEDEGLIKAIYPRTAINYAGLRSSYKVGEQINIKVTATGASAKMVPVQCAINGAEVVNSGQKSVVTMNANTPFAQIMTCRANGKSDRKLIHVSA